MEAFILLRYWRSNGSDATANPDVKSPTATTIVTAVSTQTSETEDDGNDHGPFFDLEFSLPAEEDEHEKNKNIFSYGEEDEEDSDGSDQSEDENELKLSLVSGSSGDSTADVNVSVSVSVSPSNDLFFKGGYVPVEQPEEEVSSNPAQSRVSLMKSATKFRVMMLKFKKAKLKLKSKAESSETTDEEKEKTDLNVENEDSGKSTAEDAPVVSLFKRRNSSKAKKKLQNDNVSVSSCSEEKKFSKEAMQRYLRKVKPLYVRVSKRYGEKLKPNPNPSLSPAKTEQQKQSPVRNPSRENESISEVTEPPLLPSNILGLKQGNLPAGLRVVCKQLRKSRSAFTAVAAAPPSSISSNHRDDSLLQQQDGIQSAILHCKRSFKASRDSDCSSSDPAPPSGKCENSSVSGAADGEETPEMSKR